MLTIINDGPKITKTNFWESEYAKQGLFFLSWNAGAARLLVPDSAQPALADMRTAGEVIVSYGPFKQAPTRQGYELMFEDGSDSPFAIQMSTEQTDRLIPVEHQGGGFNVVAYARAGVAGTWPARYRRVRAIPCLDPWKEH